MLKCLTFFSPSGEVYSSAAAERSGLSSPQLYSAQVRDVHCQAPYLRLVLLFRMESPGWNIQSVVGYIYLIVIMDLNSVMNL